MSEPFGSYTINDKRRQEAPADPCRTCGAPRSKEEPHTLSYNTPTMDCIKYLRREIAKLRSPAAQSSPSQEKT